MAIAKRFDALVRGRIIAKNLSTPIHSEQPATVPIAIHLCASVKSVVQKSSHQTPSETHANPAWGKHSTTKLTNRRVNTRMKSAIGSSRWSRAGSVLTLVFTGRRRTTLTSGPTPPAAPCATHCSSVVASHRMVNEFMAVQPLLTVSRR